MNGPAPDDSRLAGGRAGLDAIDDDASQRVIDSLQAVAPDLARDIIEYGLR